MEKQTIVMLIYNLQTDKNIFLRATFKWKVHTTLKDTLLQQQQQYNKCAARLHHHSEQITRETPGSFIVHASHTHVQVDG